LADVTSHARKFNMSQDTNDDQQEIADKLAAFNDRQMTDDNGNLLPEEEETSEESSANSEEKTSEDDTATGENSEEESEEYSQYSDDDSENADAEHAEDDSGKRYVPEKRFKDVYGKMKTYEREIEDLRKSSSGDNARERVFNPSHTENVDKADRLEVELLMDKYPQFNPENTESYSKVLDVTGAEILAANPGMTRLEAAREAVSRGKELSQATRNVKGQAKAIKVSQSDRGVSTSTLRRAEKAVNPDEMSLEEKEQYLRDNNLW